MNEGSNISSFTIADRYKKLFNQTFLHLLNPTSCEETKKHIQYWLSSESVEFQLEIMYEQPGIHETYSIMEALDGDPSAIWNID